jgi:hypothetical protein
VTDDAVLMADVAGPPETAATAARRLGAWQARTPIPDVPWLGGHQLAQRIRAGALDWSAVGAPHPVREIWDRRYAFLAALDPVPAVLCHGDFQTGNLIAGPAVTTVLDWGTLAAGPLGADLAHLALSTGEDPLGAYLDGLGGGFDPDLVRRGYHVTMALTASSRVHWMLSRHLPIPPHYVPFATAAAAHLVS